MVAGLDLLPMFMQILSCDALDKKSMPDFKADEYLKEWVNAERVRRRCVKPDCHLFRYVKHSQTASILFEKACLANLALLTCGNG